MSQSHHNLNSHCSSFNSFTVPELYHHTACSTSPSLASQTFQRRSLQYPAPFPSACWILNAPCSCHQGESDDWSIQLKCWQVIFRAQVGNRYMQKPTEKPLKGCKLHINFMHGNWSNVTCGRHVETNGAFQRRLFTGRISNLPSSMRQCAEDCLQANEYM